MKIDKLIVSVDNSHYKDYWPLIAKVAKKVLKVTPILIKVDDEDSDFFFDGNGLVKSVKALRLLMVLKQEYKLYCIDYMQLNGFLKMFV